MSIAPLKVKRPYIGVVVGVSKSGRTYNIKATAYNISSARTNNRKGAPLGYVGAWKIKHLKP